MIAALTAALDGDWRAWNGLPADLDVPTLLDGLGPHDEPAHGTGVLAGQSRLMVVVRRRTPPDSVRAWLDGAGTVMLVEVLDPPSREPVEDVLEAWGPAARVVDGRHLVTGAMTTEHVYPERGASLTVAESYDTPPSFRPHLAAVLLFVPTDLATFVTTLGGDDRPGPKLAPRPG